MNRDWIPTKWWVNPYVYIYIYTMHISYQIYIYLYLYITYIIYIYGIYHISHIYIHIITQYIPCWCLIPHQIITKSQIWPILGHPLCWPTSPSHLPAAGTRASLRWATTNLVKHHPRTLDPPIIGARVILLWKVFVFLYFTETTPFQGVGYKNWLVVEPPMWKKTMNVIGHHHLKYGVEHWKKILGI